MQTEQRKEKHAPYEIIPALSNIRSKNMTIKSMVKLLTQINSRGTKSGKKKDKAEGKKKKTVSRSSYFKLTLSEIDSSLQQIIEAA